jgi:hypothetical protein
VFFGVTVPTAALGVDRLSDDTRVEFERTAALPCAGASTLVASGADPEGAVDGDDVRIGRLVLVDRTTILVSSFECDDGVRTEERAVFGTGFTNGLVVIVRRLMATGLLDADDPGR